MHYDKNGGIISPPDNLQLLEEQSDYISQGGELRLSNPGQLELLLATLEKRASLRSTVRGYSMTPFIRDGDVLTIAPLAGRSPKVGEIVAFILPDNGRLAIHRIIKKSGDGWLLRGDNCPQADGVIPKDNLVGWVTRVERVEKRLRLGLGLERILIAFFNRGNGLIAARRIWLLPRRAAAYALRLVQGTALYRQIGRSITNKVSISRATPSDLQVVQTFLNPSSKFRSQPNNPDVVNLVAKKGSKIIGFIQMIYHPEDRYPWTGYWLFSLYVWVLYRGTGVGEELTKAAIDHARTKGAEELLLLVYEDNKKAINLYRKHGFFITNLPALEPYLAVEKEKRGRRRIAMQKELKDDDNG